MASSRSSTGLPPRTAWIGLAVVAAGIALALLSGPAGSPIGPPDGGTARNPEGPGDDDLPAAPTPDVRVALHLDEPIGEGRTVLWTAAFQTAWDILRRRSGGDPIRLGPSVREEDVRALNEGALTPGVVDPRALTVVAGPGTEETWSLVDRASAAGRPAVMPEPHVDDVVVYARLRAGVRYAVPFHVHSKPIHFGPDRVPVRSYGIEADATGDAADRAREQVRIHGSATPRDDDLAKSAVVVLTGADGARVVVSGRSPGPTLRATWEDVAQVLASTRAGTFSVVDHLAVPRVSVVAGRTYEEVVALPDEPQGPWTKITYARQDVRLTANERGADVDAEAVLVAYGAMPRRVVLSGPFLLAMLAPGSDRPYVVAWIGTADALSRWGDPIGVPLCAAEAARFVGAWTLDPDASLRATVDFVLQQVGTSNPGMEPGRLLRDLRPHFESRTFGLAIAADGAARVDARRPDGRTPRASVRLSRDGARVLLVVPLPRGSPSEGDGEGEDAAAEERWTVARDGEETLRLTGSGEVLVLRRR